MRLSPATLLLSLLSVGCGVGSVEGTVKGQALDVEDGVVMTGNQFLGAWGSPNAAVVILTSTGQLCTSFTKSLLPNEATGLVFVLFQTGPDKKPVPLEPGEYKWVSTSFGAGDEANAKTAQVEWVSTDNQCKRVEDRGAMATAGSVKLESIDTSEFGRAAGTFTLSFGEDTIKGSFDVSKCDSVVPKSSEQVCE
jgi:hypothetical protein